MSTRYNNGSHYENHQRAAELQNVAAHAHRVGEEHGKQEHLTGHERSREAADHPAETLQPTHAPTTGHGVTAFGHNEIAALAKELWHARGCPEGSPEVDWFEAVAQLRTKALSHSG